MLVKLTHPFLWHCQDPIFLLNCNNKLNSFLSKIEKQATLKYPEVDNETDDEKRTRLNNINSYKGEAFELLIEAVIRLFPCDKRVGPIKDYEIVTRGDIGVDGQGIFGNGKKGTVQCKYRQHDYKLTANQDHLTNFTSASFMHYSVDVKPDSNGKCNLIIFTSGDSLNFYTDENMFGGMVHAVCRDDLRKLLDDNNLFWEYFSDSWKQSLKELMPNE